MKHWTAMIFLVSVLASGALSCDSGGDNGRPGEDTIPGGDTAGDDIPEGVDTYTGEDTEPRIDVAQDIPWEDSSAPADIGDIGYIWDIGDIGDIGDLGYVEDIEDIEDIEGDEDSTTSADTAVDTSESEDVAIEDIDSGADVIDAQAE